MTSLRERLTWLARAGALVFSAGAVACSVPTTDLGISPANSCSSDDDCAGSGVCATLPSGNACVAADADLAGIIFEVRTLSSSSGSTISRVLTDGLTLHGQRAAGFVVEHDLALPPLVAFDGQVIAFKAAEVSCAGADGSLPADVELRTQALYAGLGETYRGATEPAETGAHAFALKVPPGTYDVIVRPLSCGDEAPPPPRFVPDVDVSVGTTFNLEMPQPSLLTGTLDLPPDQDIDGWTLEVVEPERGVVISQSVALHREDFVDGQVPILGPGGDEMGIQYNWSGSPIVRLRDTEGVLTVHWPMSAIDLDGDGQVALRLFDLQVAPKQLEAAVVDETGGPVVAAVVIQSTGLTGSANQNASFEVRTKTGDDGFFSVALVPGTYKVQAFPVANEGEAAVEVDWEIKETDLCCGRTITAPPQSVLRGVASTPAGAPMAFAPAEARPSSSGLETYLNVALGVEPLTASAASTSLDTTGAFELRVDPNSYDLLIKPPAGTLFPWLVRPSTLVKGGGAQVVDLGALTVRYPAVLIGGVSTASGEPTGAAIRAWLPLAMNGAEGQLALRVVQIGEAIATDDGRYTMVLPPSIVSGATASGATAP